jgi:hypothetical protein
MEAAVEGGFGGDIGWGGYTDGEPVTGNSSDAASGAASAAVSNLANAIVRTATVVAGGVAYLASSGSSGGSAPAPIISGSNSPARWHDYGGPPDPIWSGSGSPAPSWSTSGGPGASDWGGSGSPAPAYYQGPSLAQQERQAHHIADEHRQYLQYLARKAAEKRAAEAAARQRRIDARDAKATAHVGKAPITKDAAGTFGGHGGHTLPPKTVGATPNTLADIAGEEASQAQAGGAGQGIGGGGNGRTIQGAADLPGCGGNSFTARTRVMLADGKTKAISSLRPGDKVEAADTKTGKNQAETITAVLVHRDTDLYDLTIKTRNGKQVIRTTAGHLFWAPSLNKWVKAANLHKGEHLKTADGASATVDGGITPKNHDGWMWDLTVPGNNDHDFYVLAGTGGTGQLGRGSHDTYYAAAGRVPVLVHNNSCPSGFDDEAASESGTRPDKGGLTRAGREYQKHMGRGELPNVNGSGLVSAGQNLLDEILSDPNADYQPVTGGGFAGGTRVIGNSIVNDRFVGATFDSNGLFQYFGVYP